MIPPTQRWVSAWHSPTSVPLTMSAIRRRPPVAVVVQPSHASVAGCDSGLNQDDGPLYATLNFALALANVRTAYDVCDPVVGHCVAVVVEPIADLRTGPTGGCTIAKAPFTQRWISL